MVVNCDGASNITDDNLQHDPKTPEQRVETEEGTVKDFSLQGPIAHRPIVLTAAGGSKTISLNSVQLMKQ
jgi:hypothetical protein